MDLRFSSSYESFKSAPSNPKIPPLAPHEIVSRLNIAKLNKLPIRAETMKISIYCQFRNLSSALNP